MKRVWALALLVSGAAMAQSGTYTGAQLLSGQADAKLQAAAKEAKAGNKKLVISAPQQWHDLILEQLRKGGGGDLKVEMHDSFSETVVLRADAAAPAAAPAPAATPAPAAPAPAPKPEAKPAPAPKPAAPPAAPAKPAAKPAPAPAPAPTPAPPPTATPTPTPAAAPTPTPQPPPATPAPPPAPAAAPTPAPAPAPAAAPAPAPAPAPAATPAPAPSSAVPAGAAPRPSPAPAAAPAAATSASSTAEVEAIRNRLQKTLNGGDAASGTLEPSALVVGDQIFDQGPVKAVVRRGGARSRLYWLEGDVNFERVELKELGADRYEVLEPLHPGNPVLRAKEAQGPAKFAAADPASAADEKKVMEQRYAGGKAINGKLKPTELQEKDVIYVGNKLAVVVRLVGLDVDRFFLVGEINLQRSQLSKDGANKYRVQAPIKD